LSLTQRLRKRGRFSKVCRGWPVRAYLIDEISASDIEKITTFLNENSIRSRLSSIFWVKIPSDLLSGDQYEHKDCQPYVITFSHTMLEILGVGT
jgi:hypothetical protein